MAKVEQREAPVPELDADKQQQQVVPANRAMVDYGEDVNSGFQNQTKDDYAIPFIDILQPGSPEVLEAAQAADRSKGARAGDIVNRVTGETWDGAKGIAFIGAITEHCYTEWKPKKGPNGELLKGGFVARHELTEDICQTARKEAPFKAYRLPNGNDLIETFYVFGPQVFEDGSTAPIGIAFSSTKIKGYKNWSYVARAIQVFNPRTKTRDNPPLFSHVYRMTTKMRKEGQNTWFIPVISFNGADAESCRLLPDDPLFLAAKGIMAAQLRGDLKADYSKTTDETRSTAAAGEDPPF